MSRTTNLCCRTCKESIWIGQNDALYSGEPHTMEGLRQFLIRHRVDIDLEAGDYDDHVLVYTFEPSSADFKEVDTNQYKITGDEE